MWGASDIDTTETVAAGPALASSVRQGRTPSARPSAEPTSGDGPRLWRPKQVLITPAALEHPHGRRIRETVEQAGIDVAVLPSNRLTGLRGRDQRETYARAKSTLAVVVSPPGQRRLTPVPPSADWRFSLADGCPAHCQYCYLAGSLSGPPVTRVYANLEEILAGLRNYERPGEETTFEASCYSDPLALEHLTGSLSEAVRWFAGRPGATLRWTTKFDAVQPLLDVAHSGRTQARFSVNAAPQPLEGGTAPVRSRLSATARMAGAGYPVGLVVAPILADTGWSSATPRCWTRPRR